MIEQVTSPVLLDRCERFSPGFPGGIVSLKDDLPDIFVPQAHFIVVMVNHGSYILHLLFPVDAVLFTYNISPQRAFLEFFKCKFKGTYRPTQGAER